MVMGYAVLLCACMAVDGPQVRLENPVLRVTLGSDNGLLAVLDKRTGQTWNQYRVSRDGGADCPAPELLSVTPERRRFVLRVWLDGRRKDGASAPAPFELVVSLDAAEAEMTLDFIPKTDGAWNEAAHGDVFALASDTSHVLLPHAEGLLAPVRRDAPDFLDLGKDYIYSGLGAYCACLGLVDTARGDGLLYYFDDPELAGYESATLTVNGVNVMAPRLVWRGSKHQFSRPPRVTVCFEAEGGYVALAKRYENRYRAKGLFKSLREKAEENPAVDALVGAPVFWVHRTPQDVLDVATMLKDDGVDRAILEVGFTNYEVVPGGEKDATDLEGVVRRIRDMGYVVSRYDQYRDAFRRDEHESPYHQINTDAYPDGCVRNEDGSLRPAWPPGFVINPVFGLDLAKKHIPADLERYAYSGRFIDCVGTCLLWEAEDWNPARPLDVYGARDAREELLRYVNTLGLVVGTEGGIDCFLRYLHWLETPMSLVRWTAPGLSVPGWEPVNDFEAYRVSIGTTYRIPFFSLVHHAEVLITWRWEDGFSRLPKYWRDKILWSLLYGNPPMFFLNREAYLRERERIAETCREVCAWTRRVGYAEMTSHRFVTPNRHVQETTFSTGDRIVVNFGDPPYVLPDGTTVAGKGYVTW